MNVTLDKLIKLFQLVGILVVGLLFVFGAISYPGNSAFYFLFSTLSFLLVLIGFSRKAIFFDTFIALFFFLGFWVRLTVGLVLYEGFTGSGVGLFKGSAGAYDEVILVASLGFAGLLLARYIRQRFFFSYENISTSSLDGLFALYTRYRSLILVLFVFAVVFVCVVNLYLGIYQRGMISQTHLPFGLNGVFKWLLMFGFASFSALLLRFEYQTLEKSSYLVAFITIFETTLSNLSLLSRGMILNGGALIYGFYKYSKQRQLHLSFQFIIPILLIFVLLFGTVVIGVNYVRAHLYAHSTSTNQEKTRQLNQKQVRNLVESSTKQLFLDRWVGLDGIMAVSSYSGKGWGLWKSAWNETFVPQSLSFYDKTFIDSPYKRRDEKTQHFISLPGLIAFCYYPGSLLFVFFALFIAGLIGASFEWLVFQLLGAELVLCSLVGEVIAYRFMSFGYVPMQSYLLFGALFLNILLIFGMNKFFSWLLLERQSKKS